MKLLHYWKSKASALIIMLTRKRRRVGSRVPDHSQYKHRRTCNKIRRPFNETKQDPRPYCDYYHCSTVGMRQECLKLAVGRVRSKWKNGITLQTNCTAAKPPNLRSNTSTAANSRRLATKQLPRIIAHSPPTCSHRVSGNRICIRWFDYNDASDENSTQQKHTKDVRRSIVLTWWRSVVTTCNAEAFRPKKVINGLLAFRVRPCRISGFMTLQFQGVSSDCLTKSSDQYYI